MYVDLVTIPDSVCASEYDGSLNKGVVCASGPGSVVQSTCEVSYLLSFMVLLKLRF